MSILGRKSIGIGPPGDIITGEGTIRYMAQDARLLNLRETMAQDLRRFMQEYAPSISEKNPDASAVGVGWREGDLRFIVQAQTLENVEKLKMRLPEEILGFRLRAELCDVPNAAVRLRGDSIEIMVPRRPLRSRLSAWISKLFIPR